MDVCCEINGQKYRSFAGAYYAADQILSSNPTSTVEIKLLKDCEFNDKFALSNVKVTTENGSTLTVNGVISAGTFECPLAKTSNTSIEGGYFSKETYKTIDSMNTILDSNSLYKAKDNSNGYWRIYKAIGYVTENGNKVYCETFAEALDYLKDEQNADNRIVTIFGEVNYSGSISTFIGVTGDSDAKLNVYGNISEGLYNVEVYASGNATGGIYNKDVKIAGQTTGGYFNDSYEQSINVPSTHYTKDTTIGEVDAFQVCFIAAKITRNGWDDDTATQYDDEIYYFDNFTDAYNYANRISNDVFEDLRDVITIYEDSSFGGIFSKDVTVNGNYTLTIKNGSITGGTFDCKVATQNSTVSGGRFLISKNSQDQTLASGYEFVTSDSYYEIKLIIRDVCQVVYYDTGWDKFVGDEETKTCNSIAEALLFIQDVKKVISFTVLKDTEYSGEFTQDITVDGTATLTLSGNVTAGTFNCPVVISHTVQGGQYKTVNSIYTKDLCKYDTDSNGYYEIYNSNCTVGDYGFYTFDEAYTATKNGSVKTIELKKSLTYSSSTALSGITVNGSSYTLTVSKANITDGIYNCGVTASTNRTISGGKFAKSITKVSVVKGSVPVQDGSYYVIKTAKASINEDEYFLTFEEAYNAATTGQTVYIYDNISYNGSLTKDIKISGTNTITIRNTDSVTAGTYDVYIAFNKENVTGGKFNTSDFSKEYLDHGTLAATVENGYRVLKTATCQIGEEKFATFDDAYTSTAFNSNKVITLLGTATYSGTADLTGVTVNSVSGANYSLTVKNANITGGTYNVTVNAADRKIVSGLFKYEVAKIKVAEKSVPVKESDNYYHICAAECKIGDVYYLTFEEAYAVEGNNNIELIANCSYSGNLTKNITISGNYTLTLTNAAKISAGTYDCKLASYNKDNISAGCKFLTSNFNKTDLDHENLVALTKDSYYEIIEAVATITVSGETSYYSTFAEAVTAAGTTNTIDILVDITYENAVNGIKVKSTKGKTLTLTNDVKNSTFDCKVVANSNKVYEDNKFINNDNLSFANERVYMPTDKVEGYYITSLADYICTKGTEVKYFTGSMNESNVAAGWTIKLFKDYTYTQAINFNVTFTSDGNTLTVNGAITAGTYNCNVKASNVSGGSFVANTYNKGTNLAFAEYYDKVESNGMLTPQMLGVCRIVYTKNGKTQYETYDT